MVSKNDDYGYIQQFIEYLKQIIEMIMNLFNGGSKEEETPDAEENA